MIRYFYVVLFLLISTLCINCSERNQTIQIEFTHTLELVDSIFFPIDSITPAFGRIRYYEERANTPEVIVYLNDEFNSLQFYDFKSKQQIKTIRYEKEGPNGVSRVTGFYFHNWDSIFVLNSYGFKLYLTDSSNRVKRRYNLLDSKIKVQKGKAPLAQEDAYCCLPTPDSRTQIELLDNNLYIVCTPSVIGYENHFKKGKFLTELNIETGKTDYYLDAPIQYLKATYPISLDDPRITFNPDINKFIYSFPIDDSIRVLNVVDNTNIAYNAQSSHFDKIPSMKKREHYDKIEFTRKHSSASPHYERVLYDKYRKVYYRFVWLPEVYPKFKSGYRIQITVIILDEDFNRIGETMLPLGTTNTNIFVTEEGLLNRWYDTNEDYFIFAIFKLREIENETN